VRAVLSMLKSSDRHISCRVTLPVVLSKYYGFDIPYKVVPPPLETFRESLAPRLWWPWLDLGLNDSPSERVPMPVDCLAKDAETSDIALGLMHSFLNSGITLLAGLYESSSNVSVL